MTKSSVRCRCRGHGAPEIIDPCIRELVDCLNRHGVETISSCCGHGTGPGDIVLALGAIEPNVVASGDQIGWLLKLSPKPILLPYCDDTHRWEDEYPVGGKSLIKEEPAPTKGSNDFDPNDFAWWCYKCSRGYTVQDDLEVDGYDMWPLCAVCQLRLSDAGSPS